MSVRIRVSRDGVYSDGAASTSPSARRDLGRGGGTETGARPPNGHQRLPPPATRRHHQRQPLRHGPPIEWNVKASAREWRDCGSFSQVLTVNNATQRRRRTLSPSIDLSRTGAATVNGHPMFTAPRQLSGGLTTNGAVEPLTNPHSHWSFHTIINAATSHGSGPISPSGRHAHNTGSSH